MGHLLFTRSRNKISIFTLSRVKIWPITLNAKPLVGPLPSILNNTFIPKQELHKYNTRGSAHNQVSIPKVNTQLYGIKSIKFQSAHFWNNIVYKYPEKILHIQNKPSCKKFVSSYLLDGYKV